MWWNLGIRITYDYFFTRYIFSECKSDKIGDFIWVKLQEFLITDYNRDFIY